MISIIHTFPFYHALFFSLFFHELRSNSATRNNTFSDCSVHCFTGMGQLSVHNAGTRARALLASQLTLITINFFPIKSDTNGLPFSFVS